MKEYLEMFISGVVAIAIILVSGLVLGLADYALTDNSFRDSFTMGLLVETIVSSFYFWYKKVNFYFIKKS